MTGDDWTRAFWPGVLALTAVATAAAALITSLALP